MTALTDSGRSDCRKLSKTKGSYRPEADFGDKQLTVRVAPALKAQAVVLVVGSS
jgi:hypothetical protein